MTALRRAKRRRARTAARSDPAVSLVGAGELTRPTWADVDQQVAASSLWGALRAIPAAMALVIRLAWNTAPRLVVLMVPMLLASGLATTAGILSSADVLTALLAQGPAPERLVAALPAVAQVAIAYSVRAMLEAAVDGALGALTPRVRQAAQLRVHEAVSSVQLLAFEDASFRELVERSTGMGIRYVESSVRHVGYLISAGVSLAAAVVGVGLLHPLLIPVLLIAVMPEAWASGKAAKLGYRTFLDMISRERRQAVAGRLLTERDTAAELRAFGLRQALLADYRATTDSLTRDAVRMELQRTGIYLTGRTLAGVGTGVGYGALALLLYAEQIPLALAGGAVVAMRAGSVALSTAMLTVNQLYEGTFYIDLYQQLIRQCAERQRPPARRRAPAEPGVIRLAGVSFTYPGQHRAAVHGVDLTITRGQVVALVGENGSGKSTLAKLLTGLYPPDAGTVSWDGVDLAQCDPRSLADAVAVVSQEPARWPMSALTSVRIGRLDRSDTDGRGVAHAVDVAGLRNVVERLPRGWDTVLSREFEGGHDLSGGEWQRMSVARALFRDAAVLVADEPTAALDARAEAAVYEALRTLQAGRTCVLITHRMASVRHADQIVVLHDGEIVELGTHEALMAQAGRYRELYELQAQAYRANGHPLPSPTSSPVGAERAPSRSRTAGD